MNTNVTIEYTPNPNALKFVLNSKVIATGNYTYKNKTEAASNAIAEAIFEVSNTIDEVYFCSNFITVTQDGTGDWQSLRNKIQQAITDNIEIHDPDSFETTSEDKPTGNENGDLAQINAILDARVRPALQGDGGDLRVLSYENHTLKIFYQGACGSCPSAAMGTLYAIQNLLRQEFDPEIVVEKE